MSALRFKWKSSITKVVTLLLCCCYVAGWCCDTTCAEKNVSASPLCLTACCHYCTVHESHDRNEGKKTGRLSLSSSPVSRLFVYHSSKVRVISMWLSPTSAAPSSISQLKMREEEMIIFAQRYQALTPL